MFAIKRNHVIISALVVMIAVAGYLNYVDNRDKTAPIASMNLTPDNEISALVLDNSSGQEIAVVNATSKNVGLTNTDVIPDGNGISVSTSDNEDTNDTEPGAAVFVNSANDSSYFVQAKLNREQARSTQKSMLTDIINNANIDQDKKAESAEALLVIQSRIEKETAAEALIESKGFTEVYVRIDDESVDVVVNKPELSDAEIAQIEDIVKRKTGYGVEQIHINPAK